MRCAFKMVPQSESMWVIRSLLAENSFVPCVSVTEDAYKCRYYADERFSWEGIDLIDKRVMLNQTGWRVIELEIIHYIKWHVNTWLISCVVVGGLL